jgi:hypothetical protein
MESILIPMIRGYLFVCRGLDQSWHEQYRVSESNRIAARVRDRFGRFDETDQERCASVIRAVMKSEPDPRATLNRNPQAEREAWAQAERERRRQRVLAEARTRERDQRLKTITWF